MLFRKIIFLLILLFPSFIFASEHKWFVYENANYNQIDNLGYKFDIKNECLDDKVNFINIIQINDIKEKDDFWSDLSYFGLDILIILPLILFKIKEKFPIKKKLIPNKIKNILFWLSLILVVVVIILMLGYECIFLNIYSINENTAYTITCVFISVLMTLLLGSIYMMILWGDGIKEPKIKPSVFNLMFNDYNSFRSRFIEIINSLNYEKKYECKYKNCIIEFYSFESRYYSPKYYKFLFDTYAIMYIDDITKEDIDKLVDIYYKYINSLITQDSVFYNLKLVVCCNKRNKHINKVLKNTLFYGENEEGIMICASFYDKEINLTRGNFYGISFKKILSRMNDNKKRNQGNNP